MACPCRLLGRLGPMSGCGVFTSDLSRSVRSVKSAWHLPPSAHPPRVAQGYHPFLELLLAFAIRRPVKRCHLHPAGKGARASPY